MPSVPTSFVAEQLGYDGAEAATECADFLLKAGSKIDATNNVRCRALSPRFRPRESAPAVPLPRAHGESAALSRARLRCTCTT